jgi:predicted regulator of Ras-like GTPase activity (Roadblock/LC7/MglB family)
MSLLVDQLIYTNLSKTGFQLLTSPQVPLEVQDGFIHQVVYKLWDAYNPPPPDQRKVFLQQITTTQTLFGWLYIDGRDELGRSSIPYFVSYSLAGELQLGQLEEIINYLGKGPIYFIERERLGATALERVVLPMSDHYKPARPGVKIADEDIARLAARLTSHKLLQFQTTAEFEPVGTPDLCVANGDQGDVEGINNPKDQSVITQPALDLVEVEQLLRGVLGANNGIVGLMLLGSDGNPLTPLLTQELSIAADLEKDAAVTLAKNLLAIANSSQQLLNLGGFQHGELHLDNGHWVLSQCLSDCYLLTITEKMLTGLLEIETKRLIKKIGAIAAGEYTRQDQDYGRRSTPFSSLTTAVLNRSNGSAATMEADILYRGRRLSS